MIASNEARRSGIHRGSVGGTRKGGRISVSFSSAKLRVCPARRSFLLMRAECSANRVALVRTRSINEIKTKTRESAPFARVASLQPVAASRSVDLSVGRSVVPSGDESTVGSSRGHPSAS